MSAKNTAPDPTRRRVSFVQSLAFFSVLGVLLLEAAYLLSMAVWYGVDESLPDEIEVAAAVVIDETDADPVASEPEEVEPETEPEPPMEVAVVAEPPPAPVVVPVPEPEPVVKEAKPPPPAPVITPEPEPVVAKVEPPPSAPEVVSPVASPDERVAPFDPVGQQARVMLDKVLEHAAAGNLDEAERELDRIHVMAPDYVPAHAASAKILERRGRPEEAIKAWGKVLSLTETESIRETAQSELVRLKQVAAAKPRPKPPAPKPPPPKAPRKTPKPKAPAPKPPPPKVRPAPKKVLRIADVERERFRGAEDYDEMRMLRVTVEMLPDQGRIDESRAEVRVTFYDQGEKSSRLNPTHALVPTDPLPLKKTWHTGRRQTVTAAYIVPRGGRQRELAKYGERAHYHGYTVELLYNGVLQDSAARPASLGSRLAP